MLISPTLSCKWPPQRNPGAKGSITYKNVSVLGVGGTRTAAYGLIWCGRDESNERIESDTASINPDI